MGGGGVGDAGQGQIQKLSAAMAFANVTCIP